MPPPAKFCSSKGMTRRLPLRLALTAGLALVFAATLCDALPSTSVHRALPKHVQGGAVSACPVMRVFGRHSLHLRGGQEDDEVYSDDRPIFKDASDAPEVEEESDSGTGWAPAENRPSASSSFVVAGAVCGISLLSAELASLIGIVIGIAYPAFLSLKALGGGEGGEIGQLKRLLAYWACLGGMQVVEAALWPLLAGARHYNVAKLIAIYWMQGGGFAHSTEIYNRWMHPVMATHAAGIDRLLKWAGEGISERVVVAEGATGRAARRCIKSLIALKDLGATAKA